MSLNPAFKCPVAGCEVKVPAVSGDVQVLFLQTHNKDAHGAMQAPLEQRGGGETGPRAQKLQRPVIPEDCSEVQWSFFMDKWDDYKGFYKLSTREEIYSHLRSCCSDALQYKLYAATGGTAKTMLEEDLFREIKRLAVMKVNTAVHVKEFWELRQDPDEPVRQFKAKLQGKALSCEFQVVTNVTCGGCAASAPVKVSYMEEMIRHKIITGLADADILQDVLAADLKGLEQTVVFVEGKESGKKGQQSLASPAGVNKISTAPPPVTPSQDRCRFCGRSGHGSSPVESTRKSSCPAWNSTCHKCDRKGHFKVACKGKPKSTNTVTAVVKEGEAGVNTISSAKFCSMGMCQVQVKGRNKGAVEVPHWLYNQVRGWVKGPPSKHPVVDVNVRLCGDGYGAAGVCMPGGVGVSENEQLVTVMQAPFSGLADTGAQTTCSGLCLVRALGLQLEDLIPVTMTLNTAVEAEMLILGALFIEVVGMAEDGEMFVSKQLCYIARGLKTLYLSQDACKDLGLIAKNFPKIGSYGRAMVGEVRTEESRVSVGKLVGLGGELEEFETFGMENSPCKPDQSGKCQCPRRGETPAPPPLPSAATEENRDQLEEQIRSHYRSSVFNQCGTQKLPEITGPPLKIFIKKGATPQAVHKAIPVPIHWREEVRQELERDCALGILERVEVNTPAEWCCRMVCVPRKSGKHRRTVDLQPLNRASLRQTHHTASPWHLARSVPANMVKSVCDVWNSYHTVPIRVQDRKYTQFITPWGRFRYCRAPMGAHWSGDAFTQRYDEITKDVENIAKCVDDAILWAEDIAGAFAQVCDYLTLIGNNGIVLNPDKFHFAQKSVDFAGFTITPDSVKPCEEYLEGILNFPAPTDISGARSFFGLVNQASYAFSMREVMQPFRDLLKKGNKFEWTDKLQQLFEEAKQHIVELVKEGVRIFDMSKPTCLATDWCRQGIGFFLMQKHCLCSGPTIPTCCATGWKLVFAGGKFATPAEGRYSPVEGEALAVVVALYKARYFVLGCASLTVATDHKPLLKVLGDRQLCEMENPRLTNLKEKAMYFRFDIVHVPGRFHKGPDAMSRMPRGRLDTEQGVVAGIMEGVSTKELRLGFLQNMWSPQTEEGVCDMSDYRDRAIMEDELRYLGVTELEDRVAGQEGKVAGCEISAVGEKEVMALTWDRLAAATLADPDLGALKGVIETGSHQDVATMGVQFPVYKGVMDKLSTVDGVVVYKGRAVVPTSLRETVLEILHSAHQGVSGMYRRAEACVYWPGMMEAITGVRIRCESCHRVAPSQPAPPPTNLPEPQYPFELIAADYCSFQGHTYLVTVDRYSGWLSVYYCGMEATAKQLIEMLKVHFTTFGISQELASDEGSQFTAGETKRFLEAWGCSQRLSSAYYPHSNCRAELGVKSAKRLLRENINQDGSLSGDRFFRALMQHRNTPDPDTGTSPAEVLFGHPIRDFMPIKPGKFRPQEGWRLAQEDRERALRVRYCRGKERWSEHTKELSKLSVGDKVLIQNQWGTPKMARRWDRSGVVLEVGEYDQYQIKVDGTGRITTRNRRFLRKVQPYQPQQPVHRAQLPALPDNRDRQIVRQTEQVERVVDDSHGLDMVDRVAEQGQGDTVEVMEQQEESAGAVGEEQIPSEEPRRSGRERKTNVKYDSETWDLDRD